MSYQKTKPKFTVNEDYSVSSLPRVVRIEPSSFCNLKCIHCPTGTRQDSKRGNMSLDVFYKIVDEIKKYNTVDVVVLYHGGESFLNKNIFEMISVFKEMNISRIQTNTNGCLFDDEMAGKIINSGLTRIEFSIDGLSPDENNQIRRGADYERIALAIKKLLFLRRKYKECSLKEIYIVNTQIPREQDVILGKEISTPQYIIDDFSEFQGEVMFKNTYMLKWPAFNGLGQYKTAEFLTDSKFSQPDYCDHIVELITFRHNGDVVPCYRSNVFLTNALMRIWYFSHS